MFITPEKRNNLIKLGAATLAVFAILWFVLINPARQNLAKKLATQTELTKKAGDKRKVIERAEHIESELKETSARLNDFEDHMVSGDAYRWVIKTFRKFEVPHRIEFSKYEPPKESDSNVSSKLPYKTVSFVISGTAAYHDFGKFLADFENAYPHIRVRRLELEPAGIPAPDDEKLSFVLEINVLMKTSRSAAGTALSRR